MFYTKWKLTLMVSLVTGLALFLLPGQAQAQWPPFKFSLNTLFQDGKITYDIQFSKTVEGAMADVVFKIPLPEGTRFVEAGAPETTTTSFDGAEVTFFSPVVHKPLKNVYFVVEVTDPAKTEFTTHAWIAWKGDFPGDYLTEDSSIDITRTPLIWQEPRSRLKLEAGAVSNGDTINYALYPKNIGSRRMWDLTVVVPLPPGTSFISAQAPPPFEAGFDGQQIVFSILEFERKIDVEPLRFQISTTGVTTPLLTTQALASWTNVGRNVTEQEFTKTGDIIVQPGVKQQVVADAIGDTPFANYDLTGIAFQPDGATLKTTFYTAGDLGSIGEPIEHYLYIDSDCNSETGKARSRYGAEYWVRYRHQNGKAYLYTWNAEENSWANRQTIGALPSETKTATAWIPTEIIDTTQQEFCWLAVSRNRTDAYHPNPPLEWIGREPRLNRYTLSSTPAE